MEIKILKNKLFNQESLATDESLFLFQEIMNGNLTEIDISAILTSLKIKGETKTNLWTRWTGNRFGELPICASESEF